MRVYDIAMVLVRTSAAIEFVHAIAALIYTGIRFAFLIDGAHGSAWLIKVELATWFGPVETFAIGGALLLASKPIARFASRFAEHSDAARQFD